MKSIIYLSPVVNRPAGGIKIIYRHAEILSKHLPESSNCKVFHFNDVNFKCDWFSHNVLFKKNTSFDSEKEFVILPEWMASYHAKILKKLNVKYAIFVLNGFYIYTRPNDNTTDKDIYEAYNNAEFILSCSEEITKGIEFTFPEHKKKIKRVNISVDSNKFNFSEEEFNSKENLIAYMPRKKKTTSDILIFLLKKHLPKNWKFTSIDNLKESEVINTFKKSKIFLSFSELEGLGLPPIESAFCGNYVIGYTGEGGKEFWKMPIFEEIEAGDVLGFAKKVIDKVNYLDKNSDNYNNFKSNIKILRKKYSIANEEVKIINLVDLIKKIFY